MPNSSSDRYPGEDRHQRWLDSLLEEGRSEDGWHRPAGECVKLQELLRQPRELQTEVLLALLVRVLWLFECKGPRAVADLFLLFATAKLLLARKLPWSEDGLTALVLLTSAPNIAQELGELVIRQVHWYGSPGEPVRRALKRLKRAGRFHRLIEPLLKRQTPLPICTSSREERQLRSLLAHARRLPDETTRRWFRKGTALLKDYGYGKVEESLLPWLWSQLKLLHRDHPRLLRGLVVLLGSVPSQTVAEFLEKAVKWGYRRRQGFGAQDLSLARSAIRSLGRMGTSQALAFLVILGSELRYVSATEELLRVLRWVARYRGCSLHTLVEVKTAAWGAETALGKRLWRSHSRRLERCLRTGRAWSLPEWLESYQDSPLLGAMGRKLLWVGGQGAFRWDEGAWRDQGGVEVEPQGAIRLWHPVEHPGESWSVRQSPFPQVDREVFQELEFEPCLLRQYQLVALMGERDWHFPMAGRFRAVSEATLNLGGHRIFLRIERAAPVGPFSKEGASIQVRALSVRSEPPLEALPPRIRSELVRDLRLFRTVAGREL